MISTPNGARKHYTCSYSDFFLRFDADPNFQRWFAKVATPLPAAAQDSWRRWHPCRAAALLPCLALAWTGWRVHPVHVWPPTQPSPAPPAAGC
jgi:hypothetical protein